MFVCSTGVVDILHDIVSRPNESNHSTCMTAFNLLKALLLIVFAPLGQDRSASALESVTQSEIDQELVVIYNILFELTINSFYLCFPPGRI